MTGHWPLGDLWPVGAPPVPGLSPGLGWERRGRPPFSEWGADLGGGKVSWSPCPPFSSSAPLPPSLCLFLWGGGGLGAAPWVSPSLHLGVSLSFSALAVSLHLSSSLSLKNKTRQHPGACPVPEESSLPALPSPCNPAPSPEPKDPAGLPAFLLVPAPAGP